MKVPKGGTSYYRRIHKEQGSVKRYYEVLFSALRYKSKLELKEYIEA